MRLVDAQEVAERLGMCRDWVYRRQDKLPVVRVGGVLRFDLDRLEEMALAGAIAAHNDRGRDA